ncbi:hypothetical protein [uncultured Polaribacter sp.]|uniref:hypothetical protein n=1 Tax=uncultured Polaribacter sp. TaxID=174711 RepID=UPI00259B10E0|nr:hypothetical protein [uncultured Polaribacter sp.]
MLAEKYLRDELNKFAKYVIQQSRSNLTKGKKNTSKELYNSLGYDVSQSAKETSMAFKMADYGSFVDKGVQGKDKSVKAPNSPYKFGRKTGKKGGLTKGIDKWVRRRGIQFRDKKGRFLSYEQTSFIITRSVYSTGIKASMFFTKPFERAFKRLPDDLVKAYSIGIEKQIQINLKEK